ncbi:MAG: site-2 protease family protein, partial [Campylobacterota bacterium]|nr:site-2 protease family protein [Campylobacterota bacterium]
MIKLSNSYLLKIFTRLLILLVVAKAISLVLWWYLPSDGVELAQKESYQPKYQRVDFKNMIKNSLSAEKTQAKSSSSSKSVSITNMVLKGLYGTDTKGFVIVALKSSPKETTIVAIDETYSGFTLKGININSAVFTKNSQEYLLELEKIKSQKNLISRVQESSDPSLPKSVARGDIAYYAKNPKEIWKDISIVEVKNGNKIDGFRVTKIKRNSKMASLGLKKGDIIIKANNRELKSYKDALDIYAQINDLDAIEIVVLRNKQEKELVYEI